MAKPKRKAGRLEIESAEPQLAPGGPARNDIIPVMANAAALLRYVTRFRVECDGREEFVDVASIDWIESDRREVKIWVGSRFHVLRHSINRLEGQLDPSLFSRIHPRFIVNRRQVRERQVWQSGECVLVLEGGTALPVALSYQRLGRLALDQP